ncbi:MAG: NAD(+) diphosphatase [Desulfobacula sp.]|jgi:NAD+ diphosphatase|uniref:NAD(+) diphosphatase n=2 Tax=Desulfobacula sp. TaxID=2593537 RepID=UPI001E11DE4E|nr:NAD(+) diphosphatase [Desulfobacula sp.]MBT4024391.1 NAD(+) diphosphatase [Desulfobacula sp.]MBT4875579.1 NAD(+) diphosphatase [Desulfobacula sp.]MBT5546031.1 NAD(+) diphosphatase [Desulfobacula sp.]MBT5972567.1 NAD(+) diphosphatase [Desulfobacula sp.]
MTNLEFKKAVSPPESGQEMAYFFIYCDNFIYIYEKEGQQVSIPVFKMSEALKLKLEGICFLGMIGDRNCYCTHAASLKQRTGLKPINIRAIYEKIDSLFWQVAGYARQIHDWNLNFQYCGRCGRKTERKEDEHVRICSHCNLTNYPRISPATIIAVVKENQILLARGVNFPNKKMFSVLAGFVEPAETLEECVKREVFEETGIIVKNIQYFKSQSWPFPDSLMIGFIAEYKSGEILIDKKEIEEAAWFSPDKLPLVPSRYTIARELIDWFVAGSDS